MKCEVCRMHEATMKDYRDDGEKWRSCKYCGHLSSKNWYYIMYNNSIHEPVDPKTFYEEEDSDDD